MPVRVEERAVGVEVAEVGGSAIRAVEYRKKVWEKIDEHQQPRPRVAARI